MPEPKKEDGPTPALDVNDHGRKLAKFFREMEEGRNEESRLSDLHGGSGEHRELD